MENNKEIIHESEVKELIIELRGEKVLIDRDVAKLYGVETKRINEAVKNNRDKFPNGYMFSLQVSEKQQLVENFDRFSSLKHSPVEPKAFTEKGLYMLATILRSPRADSANADAHCAIESSEAPAHTISSIASQNSGTLSRSRIRIPLPSSTGCSMGHTEKLYMFTSGIIAQIQESHFQFSMPKTVKNSVEMSMTPTEPQQ